MKAYELIADPRKWTQGANARDDSGCKVSSNNSNAVQWCLVGSLGRCYPELIDYANAKAKVNKILGSTYDDDAFPLIEFNDAMDRTHQEVVDLLKKAGV